MTRVTWGDPSKKIYQYGIDRGVLYYTDEGVYKAAAWDGLTSVDAVKSNGDTRLLFQDGISVDSYSTIGDLEFKLSAFTYPDEFETFDGVYHMGAGVYVDEQPVFDRFGLSYRVNLGTQNNRLIGYRIHLLYNLIAIPDSRTAKTISDHQDLDEFTWSITGIPIALPGVRPTYHFYFDSRRMPAETWVELEEMLYGSDISDGTLPSIADLKSIIYSGIQDPIDDVF